MGHGGQWWQLAFHPHEGSVSLYNCSSGTKDVTTCDFLRHRSDRTAASRPRGRNKSAAKAQRCNHGFFETWGLKPCGALSFEEVPGGAVEVHTEEKINPVQRKACCNAHATGLIYRISAIRGCPRKFVVDEAQLTSLFFSINWWRRRSRKTRCEGG